MARKKKDFKTQLSYLKSKRDSHQAKTDEYNEAIRNLWEENTKTWFDELTDILKKGIEDESIDIEVVTPTEVFNFCVRTTTNGSENKINTSMNDTKDAQKNQQAAPKAKTETEKKTDDANKADAKNENQEVSNDDKLDNGADANWSPVVYS